MRIIICGGHLTPAVATIEELKKVASIKYQVLSILFIGRKYPLEGDSAVSPEYKIITQMGIPFVSLMTGRLQRRFTRYTIPSLLKIPIGFFQSLWWVGKFKPDIILSFGGYVALPVVVAGWLFSVPTVTHEQTLVSGLANKIIGFLAQKICLSWPDSAAHFPKDKVVLTGNPLRKEIFQVKKPHQFPIPNSKFQILYITGGSLGSHALNEAVGEILPQLLEKYNVIHQCGDSQKYNDYEELPARIATQSVAGGKVDLQKRYHLTKYVEPQDIGWVLQKSDLVVSRAGANTVMELAALGKPAILIPLPWAGGGEQEKNAQMLAKTGMATILPQEELSGETLYQKINMMVGNLKNYQKQADEAKKLVDLSAARKIIEVIHGIYTSRRKN